MKRFLLIITLSICSTMFAQTITTTEIAKGSTINVQPIMVSDYVAVFNTDSATLYDVSNGTLLLQYSNTDPLYNISPNCININGNYAITLYAKDGKSLKIVDMKTKITLVTFGAINGHYPNGYCYPVISSKDKKLRFLVYYDDGTRFFTTNTTVSTSIQQTPNNDQPTSFSLSQNFPNPFNPTTSIQYSLSKPSDVKINIYDITGRLVKTLEETNANQGEHIAFWDSRDNSGSLVASGTYIYQLISNGYAEAKKMLLLK